jgi:hypothetical protein
MTSRLSTSLLAPVAEDEESAEPHLTNEHLIAGLHAQLADERAAVVREQHNCEVMQNELVLVSNFDVNCFFID